MIRTSLIKNLKKHLPSQRQKSRIWLCSSCRRRYARPRRLVRTNRLVTGECWSCGGKLERVIPPIQGNVFEGESIVQKILRRAKEPGPKDWSPRR